MVASGIACLGPVTQAGCDAICPAYGRGCYGCFGPMETPNTAALSDWWRERLDVEPENVVRAFRTYNAGSELFRRESERYESADHKND